jgi:hypothetical protein
MTSYEKTAIFILRFAGVCWVLFFIFVWTLYAIEMASGVEVQHYPLHTIIGGVGYIALGILAVALSRPLGRLIGRELDI